MPQQIVKWQTKDGRTFDAEAEAVEHEADFDRRVALECFADDCSEDDAVSMILNHWAAIKAIMEPGGLSIAAQQLKREALAMDGLELPEELWAAAEELCKAEPATFSLSGLRGPKGRFRRLSVEREE